MTQPRRYSLAETVASTAVGYGISVALNYTVLPLYGLHPTGAQTWTLAGIFTVASLIRGYVLRRVFNKFQGGTK